MLCVIIVTKSLIYLRLQLLRMQVIRTCGMLFVALHNHMEVGPTWGTRVMLKYLRRVQSELICCVYTVFWAILVICELYDFALLMLPTTFQSTNLFTFSLPISAFTNGFWLYFDGYIKWLDSSSRHRFWAQGLYCDFLWRCQYIQVELWIWVNPSSTYSYCMRSQKL